MELLKRQQQLQLVRRQTAPLLRGGFRRPTYCLICNRPAVCPHVKYILFRNKDVVAAAVDFCCCLGSHCAQKLFPGETMEKTVPWKLRQQWALSCCLKRRSSNNNINNNNNNNKNNSMENRGKDVIMWSKRNTVPCNTILKYYHNKYFCIAKKIIILLNLVRTKSGTWTTSRQFEDLSTFVTIDLQVRIHQKTWIWPGNNPRQLFILLVDGQILVTYMLNLLNCLNHIIMQSKWVITNLIITDSVVTKFCIENKTKNSLFHSQLSDLVCKKTRW